MANPYGITEVNIPALLGMHQQMQRQRIDDLYRAKQMEQIERKNAIEDRRMGVMSRLFAPGATGSAPTAATTLTPEAPGLAAPTVPIEQSMLPNGSPLSPERAPAAPVDAPPASSFPAGLTPDHPLPPRTDGLTINQNALRELYAIDPAQAAQIQQAVYNGNKMQLEQATQRGEAMAVAATALGNVPPEQRPAALRQWAPYLMDHGYTAEQLNAADLSDAGLSRYYTQGRSLKELVESRKDERDFDLKRDQFGETQRHNRASEGVAAGNLNVARGRLGVSQGALEVARGRAKGADGGNSDLDYLMGGN